MNILGIGPLLAAVGGGSFALIFLLQHVLGIAIPLPPPEREYLSAFGILLIAIGIYFGFHLPYLFPKPFILIGLKHQESIIYPETRYMPHLSSSSFRELHFSATIF